MADFTLTKAIIKLDWKIINGDTYQTGYITTDSLDYLAKYDTNPRQNWRQHYRLNDLKAPKLNAP
jgi:hypothetical protein